MLNVAGAPESILRDDHPQVGDIYRKAGGPPGFWWVISVCPNGDTYLLSFDMQGNVTGAQRYGRHYFANNDHRRVGRAALPVIEPEWL